MRLDSFTQDVKSLCQFLSRPASWIVLVFVAIVAAIVVVFVKSGFDFSMPQRLVCAGANDDRMVVLFIVGFVFLALSVASVGAILSMMDDFMKKRPVEFSNVWLPVAALVCGGFSYYMLRTTCA